MDDDSKTDGGTPVGTPWPCRRSRVLFDSPWFCLRQDDVTLPDGQAITYSLIDHPGYVVVVALTEDEQVIMERVYRYTVREVLLECPSGGLDGEPPEVAALRELEEETGWVGAATHDLGSYYGSTGSSNERFHVVLVRGCTRTGIVRRESTEQMEVVLMGFEEAVARAAAGEISNAPSAFALLRASRQLQGGSGI